MKWLLIWREYKPNQTDLSVRIDCCLYMLYVYICWQNEIPWGEEKCKLLNENTPALKNLPLPADSGTCISSN